MHQFMDTLMRFSFLRIARHLALALGLGAWMALGAWAQAGDAEQVEAVYKAVELATWVPPLRAPQRVIINPAGVSFQAVFDGGPREQKTAYLQQALKLMRVSEPPKVNQAIRLRYGPGEADTLVAYIEDGAAERLRKDIRLGERREFFAFHIYNFSKGPALVITSFGPAL